MSTPNNGPNGLNSPTQGRQDADGKTQLKPYVCQCGKNYSSPNYDALDIPSTCPDCAGNNNTPTQEVYPYQTDNHCMWCYDVFLDRISNDECKCPKCDIVLDIPLDADEFLSQNAPTQGRQDADGQITDGYGDKCFNCGNFYDWAGSIEEMPLVCPNCIRPQTENTTSQWIVDLALKQYYLGIASTKTTILAYLKGRYGEDSDIYQDLVFHLAATLTEGA